MFKLSEDDVAPYRSLEPDWGFPSGPNSVGEITTFRTYSRLKPDGTNEDWVDICKRVTEGTYELQRRHCVANDRPWDDNKAMRSALEFFDRMFNFKFLPPGRGLWMMGTDYIYERGGAPLNNCGFISTEELLVGSARPFTWLMDMSMLGVGVGFDTTGAGARVVGPGHNEYVYEIPDTREGWVESVRLLVESYLQGTGVWNFSYDLIRPKGTRIKGFGGVASGPGPLKKLHGRVTAVMDKASDRGYLTSRDIVDIQNMIGACVVAGNVRRSAELALGEVSDSDFLNLKNYGENPGRAEWGWASNNTIVVRGSEQRLNYDRLAQRIADNGEPGLFYLDAARKFGRMGDEADYKDMRASGTNPCAEQILESGELCTLVETFPSRCDSYEDFERTLKFAYLYAKTVTLVDTHDERTNEVMRRNRRIGTSASGVVQFLHRRPVDTLTKWLDDGYVSVTKLDQLYSTWLGVPKSIRRTTVKPSGTVSLLAGVTPGVHYPVADYYIRRIRLQDDHPLVKAMADAGYTVEADLYSDHTMVVEMPVKGEGLPTERDVSIYDKADLATLMARHWSDNAVSCTITFKEDEADDIASVLKENEGKWKTVSFLPLKEQGAYAQMPYESITEERYNEMVANLTRIDMDSLYNAGATDGAMEKYCETDKCEIDLFKAEKELV